MTKETGGPAFPSIVYDNDCERYFTEGGMQLRDFFAAKAFQTRLAKHSDWTLDEISDQAYKDADSLLKAREQ